jgi:uncharacterized protein YcfJ
MNPFTKAGFVTVLMLATASSYAESFTNSRGEKMVCHKVRVVHQKEWGTGGVAGAAIGGAVGGLAGNQIGGGHGKEAATAIGAVGGAVAGHEVGKKHDTYVTYENRCNKVK